MQALGGRPFTSSVVAPRVQRVQTVQVEARGEHQRASSPAGACSGSPRRDGVGKNMILALDLVLVAITFTNA